MKRKKTSKRPDYQAPSAILRSARQQTGGGAHTSSREDRNDRTGRLSGKARRDLRNARYDD
jgi:hypothetical protein